LGRYAATVDETGAGKNPLRVEQSFNQAGPRITARVKAKGASMHWGNEPAGTEDRQLLRSCASMGQTPVWAVPSKRDGLAMTLAISNRRLVRFELIEGGMNTDLMVGFMKDLFAENLRRVFLILDNLRVHHAMPVTGWFEGQSEKIEVIFLPPHSPASNPDEYLNREFMTCLLLSNRVPSKSALLEKKNAFMEFLRETSQQVSAYFKHAAVRRAS